MKKVLLAVLAVIMVTVFGFSGVLAEGTIKNDLVIGVAQEINELNPMMQNDQINNNCFALTHDTPGISPEPECEIQQRHSADRG